MTSMDGFLVLWEIINFKMVPSSYDPVSLSIL